MRRLLPMLAGALLAAGCQRSDDDRPAGDEAAAVISQPAEEKEAPLARIDDIVITVGEFQERLQKKSPYVRARYNSKERKREFLDNLIRFEVLAREAQARGFDRDPDVIRTMKQVMVQKLIKEEFETRVKPEDISDEEMRAFYKANESEYRKPEEVRVAAILVEGAARARAAAAEALGEKGRSNKGFRELVNRYSIDEESKIRGGDMRYFSRDSEDLPGPVVEAAFALTRTGDVAGPIDAGDGTFYIIRRTGKRPSVERGFEEVKRTIRNRLYQEKRTQAQADFLVSLREKAKVEIYEDNLSKVRVDASPAGGEADDPGSLGAPNVLDSKDDLPDEAVHGQP